MARDKRKKFDFGIDRDLGRLSEIDASLDQIFEQMAERAKLKSEDPEVGLTYKKAIDQEYKAYEAQVKAVGTHQATNIDVRQHRALKDPDLFVEAYRRSSGVDLVDQYTQEAKKVFGDKVDDKTIDHYVKTSIEDQIKSTYKGQKDDNKSYQKDLLEQSSLLKELIKNDKDLVEISKKDLEETKKGTKSAEEGVKETSKLRKFFEDDELEKTYDELDAEEEHPWGDKKTAGGGSGPPEDSDGDGVPDDEDDDDSDGPLKKGGKKKKRKDDDDEDEQKKPASRNNVFTFAAQLARETMQAQNGLQAYGVTADAAVNSASSLFGSLIGDKTGKVAGSVLGALADAAFASTAAGQRALREQYQVESVTGRQASAVDMSSMGINYEQFFRSQLQVARQLGTGGEQAKATTTDALLVQKAYGVDQGTVGQLLELRQTRDILGVIQGILRKGENSVFAGGDRTFLNEFLSKFSYAQRELMQTTDKPTAQTTTESLLYLNQLGGKFSMRDPRFMQNYMNLQQGLSAPDNDAKKAVAYSVLRELHPDKGFFDLNMEMEKGLASPGYAQGMFKFMQQMGMSDQLTKQTLKEFFGTSSAVANTMYENLDKLQSGKITEQEFSSFAGGAGDGKRQQLVGEAEGRTVMMDSTSAKITNAMVQGMDYGAARIVQALKSGWDEVISKSPVRVEHSLRLNFDGRPASEMVKEAGGKVSGYLQEMVNEYIGEYLKSKF